MPNRINEPGFRYQYRILDMRQIDYDALLQQDTPDALVLAILCDFNNRPAKDVVHYFLNRLKMLLKDDESGLSALHRHAGDLIGEAGTVGDH